ncbi:dockerin type I domain-containing protein [Synechococcus sp. H70.2]|uniref:dockerin type I domain-containing protein n=1 Tax=unclassified Synechococcus TaxID=2626047 RepID=UPI0039C43932
MCRVSRLAPSLLLLGSLSFGWMGVAAAQVQPFQPGDLDGDGHLTGQDLNLLGAYWRGELQLTNEQIQAADVNQDGQISEADGQVLQQRLQAATDAPPGQGQLDSAYSGQVVDRLTGQPLAGVEVAIPGAGISVRTDAQGRFRLPEPLPAEEILVARLENYLPYSQSTSRVSAGGDRPWQLQLERWDPNTTLVLEANVIRLGDNHYSPESAAAGQFLGPAQGVEMTRSFSLERLPPRPPVLRIGSLIGLDTAAAYRAGQSRIPTADMSPMRVLLNGVEVEQLQLGGDDLHIPLPLQHLRLGSNTVTLRTGKTVLQPGRIAGGPRISIPLFGGSLDIVVPLGSDTLGQDGGAWVDYDDVQLANVAIEIPN